MLSWPTFPSFVIVTHCGIVTVLIPDIKGLTMINKKVAPSQSWDLSQISQLHMGGLALMGISPKKWEFLPFFMSTL